MSSRREYESDEDLPRLIVSGKANLPRLRAAALWSRIAVAEGGQSTKVLVRVCSNEQAWIHWDANWGGWCVMLTRPRQGGDRGKIARSWYAHAQYVPGEGAAPTGPIVQLGAGTCGSWGEAVRDLAAHGAWHRLLETCLPYGHQGWGWTLLTPVVVRYPYHDPNEPNARFSPLRFTEVGAGLTIESAAAVMVWGVDRAAIRYSISKMGANAYVERAGVGRPCTVLHLWHRRSMCDFDEITETAFMARVLAGLD